MCSRTNGEFEHQSCQKPFTYIMSQHKSLLILATGLSLCFAGCEGTGPNTQGGAVTGGVLGAIAGGIIGNNSGGHNGLAGALIGGTVGAIAGGAIGNNVDHERGTIYTSQSEATTTVVVAQPPPPPPPPPYETVPFQPSPDAYWVPGHYNWDGNQYIFVGGYWTIPPHRYHQYVESHWVYRGDGRYVYVRGYWR
jgi:hypothetical protein